MKSDTTIIQTPQAVSVVSREQMDARATTTLVETLQYTAGVQGYPGGADPRFDTFQIRGFTNTGAGAYRDGLREVGDPNYFSLFRTETYGIQRVDVVKGPSSTMYGQGAPGGLIDIISKRPTEKAFGEVVGQFGNFDRFQGAFDVGGPATADGVFLYRLTGVFRQADSAIAHFSDVVKDNRTYIAPAVTWKPNNNTTLTILSDYSQDLTGNAFPLSVAHLQGRTVTGVSALPIFLGDPGYNGLEQKQARIGYQFEHRFSDDLIVRSRARYGHSELEYRYLTVVGTPLDTATSYARRAALVRENSNSFSMDNHVVGKFDTSVLHHTVVAGVDYLTLDLKNRVTSETRGAYTLNRLNPVYGIYIPTPTTPYTGAEQTIDQTGIYIQDQIRLQNWLLTLGGRFDSAGQNNLNTINGRRTDADYTKFTKRGAISYLFDFGLVPYYSYSESFFPTAGSDFSGNPFQPTEGRQHEVGVKYQPNNDLLLTAAVYDLTQKNALTQDPANLGYQVQLGKVNSRGIELEATAQVLPGLNLIASYTHQRVRVTQSTTTDLDKVPVLVPGNMASVYLDYTIQTGAWTGWGLGGGVRYRGSTFADTANTIVNGDNTVFDLGVHYRQPKGINVALNVKNLTDRVTTACTTAGGCQYTSPRTIVGTVSYKW